MVVQTDDEGRLIAGNKQIKLKPYIPRPSKLFVEMTDEEILNGAGGNLVFDTECYANYFLLAFRDIVTDKVIKFESREENSMSAASFNSRKMSWIFHNYRCIGFNSFKYDLPMVWLAYHNQNTQNLKELSNALINNMWRDEAAKEFGFQIPNTNHVDLIEVCPLRGSLKLYAARLHAERIQDLPFNHYEPLEEWQIPVVEDYCINGDLPATKLLFTNLTEQIKLRENLSMEYSQDLMSKSDAQIAEAVIGSELKRLTGTYPKKPKISGTVHYKFVAPSNMFFQTDQMKEVLRKIQNVELSVNTEGRLERPKEITDLRIKLGSSIYRMGIGGLHSSEENVSVFSDEECTLYDRDVASFYPRIVLNCKLFPEHLGEPFLLVYNNLVIRRLSAKEAKRIAESENLKVTINGTFGKTGSPYSILYAPQMTIQITVGGQLYLLMLIEYLELNNISVVSANTDGIVIRCHKLQRDKMLEIIRMWEQLTGFETEETKYEAVYSRDVNAYLALKKSKDGVIEFKGKNVFYDPWRGKSAKDQYWRFQKNPTATICIEAIEKLIANNVPIEQTIKECRDITKFVSVKNVTGGAHKDGNYLGKTIRWYYSKDVIGTINYIQSGNKVPESDKAKPCMDLPTQFPDDIFYDWYIDNTKELLYDLNYYKRPKQVTFF